MHTRPSKPAEPEAACCSTRPFAACATGTCVRPLLALTHAASCQAQAKAPHCHWASGPSGGKESVTLAPWQAASKLAAWLW